MDTKKKILIISSFICYALTICGFIISSPWFTLIFFVLHSILLLSFSYSIWHNSQVSQKSQEVTLESETSTKLKLSLEQQELLKKENALLSTSLAEAQKNCESLTSKVEELSALITESASIQEHSPESDSIYTSTKVEYDFLLPPTSSESAQAIDIIQTARDVIEELNSFAQKAGIQIQISSATENIYVKADTNRIRILFRNIIDNSIKYMNRSGNLVITMSVLGDDIFIVLKDNGNGLDESETPHIFELNYQGSNRISGNGLGLTQAKAIVNSYGGTIYAKSTANNGMGIYIQMPTK